MQGNCHKADEVDLAAVLTEPQNPEWEAFRQHYPQCEACSAEVYQWTNLENILRTMGKEIPATHPSEERLEQFQQNPGSLAPQEQHAIQQHLQACPACKEELSFDFSPIQRWIDEEKPAQAVVPERPTLREVLMDQLARLLGAVRSLVLHPAFAYGIVLILGIRVAFDSLPRPELIVQKSDVPDTEHSPSLVEQWTGPERGAVRPI